MAQKPMNGGCDVDKMADAWVDEGVGGVGGGMGGGRTGSTNGVDAGAANEGEGVAGGGVLFCDLSALVRTDLEE